MGADSKDAFTPIPRFQSPTIVKTLLAGFLSVVFIVVLSAGAVVHNIFFSAPGDIGQPAEIRVEQGDSLAAVARKLRDQKIIANSFFFSIWARFSGAEKKIHPGLYQFEAGVPPREVLDRLRTGSFALSYGLFPLSRALEEVRILFRRARLYAQGLLCSGAGRGSVCGVCASSRRLDEEQRHGKLDGR